MRLDLRALSFTFAAFCAGSVFVVGVASLIWPGYGDVFLNLAASIYPGYEPGGFGSVVIGTLYALVDGAVFGALVAWLYNMFQGKQA
ncbi:MAG: hypothetical protein AB7I33_10120 [Gemmatimonadales bacterium]